ncbi:MAG: ferredoxin, partial [Euryarchaeota archaeon]|nr:ferredoxin [Euryarchaeota archaeon]
FIEINEKYSKIWPNITEAKEPMSDHEEWKEKTNKIEVLIID